MKYAPDFSPDSARYHVVELVVRSGLDGGVMLDLGCGRAAVAQPLIDLGFEYVGTDIDADALAAVGAAGYEVHELDLRADEAELRSRMESILGDRRLAGVLAIDALEHIPDPSVPLGAIRELARTRGDISLFLSIPNVSHFDVAAKLLVGRWDYLDTGLLDDTHLHFFTAAGLRSAAMQSGWHEVDSDDVCTQVTEQLFPADAPVLRPDAPARELLARLRRSADDHAFTFQFIRRFAPGSEAGSRAPVVPDHAMFATVVVSAQDGGVRSLLADLGEQDEHGFEVQLIDEVGQVDVASATEAVGATVERVISTSGADPRTAAIAQARGRYLCFLASGDRVGPSWVRSLRLLAERAPGRILRTGVTLVDPDLGESESRTTSALLATTAPVLQHSFDYLHMAPAGQIATAAYALPTDACTTMRFRFDDEHRTGSLSVVLAEAIELCGLASIDAVLVGTPVTSMRDAEDDLDDVATARDGTPLILPTRSVSRLINIRRRLERATCEREDLNARLAARSQQVQLLEQQVERLDAQFRALRAWAEGRPEYRLRRALRSLGSRDCEGTLDRRP